VLTVQEQEEKVKKEKLVSEEITALQEVIVLLEETDQLEKEEDSSEEIEGTERTEKEEKVKPQEVESVFSIEDLELVEAKRSRKEVVEEAIGARKLRGIGMKFLRKKQTKPLLPPQLKALKLLLNPKLRSSQNPPEN